MNQQTCGYESNNSGDVKPSNGIPGNKKEKGPNPPAQHRKTMPWPCFFSWIVPDFFAKVGHAQGSNAEGRNSKEEKPRDRRLVEPSATEGAEASQLQIIDCRLLGNICFCFKCSRLWYQGARMESFVLTGLSGSFWLTRLTGAMFVERAKQFATCSKTSKQFVQLIYRAL